MPIFQSPRRFFARFAKKSYLCLTYCRHTMNIIDIFVCAVLVWALFAGWRRGLILQCCSLLGFILSVWFALHYGPRAGSSLGIDARFAPAGGFLLLFTGALIATGLIGMLLRKVFRFAGLGFADTLLGILLSLFKYTLMLCAFTAAFDALNADCTLVSRATLDSSKCYRPLHGLSGKLSGAAQALGASSLKFFDDAADEL